MPYCVPLSCIFLSIHPAKCCSIAGTKHQIENEYINKLTSVFLCVCHLIDDKLHHNIIKVVVEPVVPLIDGKNMPKRIELLQVNYTVIKCKNKVMECKNRVNSAVLN